MRWAKLLWICEAGARKSGRLTYLGGLEAEKLLAGCPLWALRGGDQWFVFFLVFFVFTGGWSFEFLRKNGTVANMLYWLVA